MFDVIMVDDDVIMVDDDVIMDDFDVSFDVSFDTRAIRSGLVVNKC